jgi:hypothetical protein
MLGRFFRSVRQPSRGIESNVHWALGRGVAVVGFIGGENYVVVQMVMSDGCR